VTKTSARDRALVSVAFPEFKGNKIFKRFEGEITFYDLNWSGGTKSAYRAVRLLDGKSQGIPDLAPWANPIEGKRVTIPDGYAVVELSWFCGAGPRATIYFGCNPALPESKEVFPPAVITDGPNGIKRATFGGPDGISIPCLPGTTIDGVKY
jgi:hypothetical protein